MRIIISVVCVILGLSGCSGNKAPGPIPISSVRPGAPNLKTVEFKIPRQEYNAALGRDDLNRRVRIVEVFQSGITASSAPEYRIFNIAPKSVYALLRLQAADVLVAAHGMVIKSPLAFERYVTVLLTEPASEIEVRRNGQAVLLKFQFT
jgi:hypothetical protein